MSTLVPEDPRVDIRRSGERFNTKLSWLDSKHSFSFGPYYDVTNTHHGPLMVNNEDIVASGAGFDSHAHRDIEVVTWVLSGALVHEDSLGHSGVIYPGLAQRMSAGRGILHSERNYSRGLGDAAEHRDTDDLTVHFVQMWVLPDERGIAPDYEQRELDPELLAGKLHPVVSGMPRYADSEAVGIGNAHVALHVARLKSGQSVDLPEAPFVHLFIARGAIGLEGADTLAVGDAARLTATGGQRVTAAEPSEILVWEMHETLHSG
jgi:redox-sensitive bicupin YhaK (pirin superfamily)